MKILWITNIPLPPICESIGIAVPPVGGWMYSSLKRILACNDGKVSVATVYSGDDFIERDVNNVTYFLLPLKGKSALKYNHDLEPL